MDSLLRDLKFSVRSLLKAPGFAVVAVLTLALGIAANTTIFSTVDALLLHPFSFPNQDRLVVMWEQNRAVGSLRGSVSPGNFSDWRDQNQTCEQVIAIDQISFDLSDGAHPERYPGYGVTQVLHRLRWCVGHKTRMIPRKRSLACRLLKRLAC